MTVRFVTTTQEVDEKQASAWIDKRYEHQRDISHAHVAELARAMFDGTFSPVTSIMLSNINGEQSLLNGQHTLLAIIKSKKPQVLPIVYYTCETRAEEAELYYRTDRNRKRTLADSMRVTELPGKLGLSPTQIRDVSAALRHIKTNFGASSARQHQVSDDDLLEWIPLWAWECKSIHRAISPCTTRERSLILRKAVLSVALITMRYQSRAAKEFWGQVARDDALERADPRKTLRDWLTSAQRQGKAPGEKLRNNELSRGAILAWNAWREGRVLRYIVPKDKFGIVQIDGTDYSGSQGSDYLPLYAVDNESVLLQETVDEVMRAL